MADRDAAPTLREAQAHLYGLVTRRSNADVVRGMVRSDDRLDAAGRVQVYANMYFRRLLDILRGDYPKLVAVLGDGPFERLAADYLQEFPSRDPSVRHVGSALPGFVESHPLGRRRRWLTELARLEWVRVEVHDRADDELLSWTEVRDHPTADLGELRLRLVQAQALLKVEYGVTHVWWRVQHGKPPGRPARSGGCILVWRQDGLVYHRMAPPDESTVLPELAAGTAFVSVCDRLGRDDTAENAARRAAELLATWTASGLLVKTWG